MTKSYRYNLKILIAKCFGKLYIAKNSVFIIARNLSALYNPEVFSWRTIPKKSVSSTLHLAILILCLLWILPSPAYAMENISLRKYPELSLPVPNPMETSKLPARKTFQVNHEEFILQFFFNERDVFGYILKRNKSRPIHFRWCFFRSCEESPYDYKKVIAQAFNPPYDSGFFSIRFPSYLNYSFQGIEFSSPK